MAYDASQLSLDELDARACRRSGLSGVGGVIKVDSDWRDIGGCLQSGIFD
jgi:hypothetical protein